MKLYRQTDEVLHYMWDPIGVRGIAQARDEYSSYLPHVFSLLVGNKGPEKIAEYLDWVVEEKMGLTPNKEYSKEISEILVGLKEAIIDEGF